ncbi:MAG TPA: hypothetical protein VGL58_05335 [Caulobacteraceae bacterium]
MKPAVLVALTLALAAAGAAAKPTPNSRGDCDIEDKRAWTTTAPPTSAGEMSALADAKPNFSVPQHWVAETWFALDGETLLCRSDAPLPKACAGEWWRFDAAGKLAAHDSWLCLAH